VKYDLRLKSYERLVFEHDNKNLNDDESFFSTFRAKSCTPNYQPVNFGGVRVFDENSRTILKELQHVWSHVPRPAPAILRLDGWCVLGRNGIAINPELGVAFSGQMFGGSIEYLKWHLTTAFGAQWSSDNLSISFDWAEPEQFTSSIEPVGFIGMTGQDIFGHWLLDFVPRAHFFRSEVIDLLGESPVLASPSLPPWGRHFLSVMNFRDVHAIELASDKVIRLRRAYTPTMLKSGYVVDLPRSGAAWRAFVANMQRSEMDGPEKIYVSRRRWPTQRPIANEPAIADLAVRRGYRIISPEHYSLEERAGLFSKARIIVGEDGSALHNIIYCQPGARLGVIGRPDRRNFWHFAFCAGLDHSIAYFECENREGVVSADLDRVDAMLAALETE